MTVAENEKVWVAYSNDDTYGPLSAVEIKQALLNGKLKDDDCVWKRGWSKWKQPKDIPIFAFESKNSLGSNRPIPDTPLPDPEKFDSLITPKVSVTELDTSKNWDAKRISIVAGSGILAGVPGAAIAGILTSKSKAKKEEEFQRAKSYIDPKNR